MNFRCETAKDAKILANNMGASVARITQEPADAIVGYLLNKITVAACNGKDQIINDREEYVAVYAIETAKIGDLAADVKRKLGEKGFEGELAIIDLLGMTNSLTNEKMSAYCLQYRINWQSALLKENSND